MFKGTGGAPPVPAPPVPDPPDPSLPCIDPPEPSLPCIDPPEPSPPCVDPPEPLPCVDPPEPLPGLDGEPPLPLEPIEPPVPFLFCDVPSPTIWPVQAPPRTTVKASARIPEPGFDAVRVPDSRRERDGASLVQLMSLLFLSKSRQWPMVLPRGEDLCTRFSRPREARPQPGAGLGTKAYSQPPRSWSVEPEWRMRRGDAQSALDCRLPPCF